MALPYSNGTFSQNKGFKQDPEEPFGLPKLLRYHERPMLWPAVGFLLGTTYPDIIAWPFVALLLVIVVCIGFLRAELKVQANATKATSLKTVNLAFPRFLTRVIPARLTCNVSFKPAIGAVLILIVAGYLAGTFRGIVWDRKISAAEQLASSEEFQALVDCVVVEVISNPKSKKNTVVFTGKIHSVMNNHSTKPGTSVLREITLPSISRGLLAHVCLYQEQRLPEPSSFVFVRGKFAVPSCAKNPGEFDYRKYLVGKQVFLELKGTIQRNRESETWRTEKFTKKPFWPRLWYKKVFHSLSRYIETRLDTVFQGDQKGIVKALFLGDKGDLSPSDSSNFRIAGLYRFIAIAGFHVQLVARAVEGIARKVFKNVHVSRIAGIGSAFFLGSISGWAVGPLRAFLCILLRHFAFWTRRKYDTLAGFAICSFVIGWRIPYPLLNASFQLSFAGMLAGWVSREYTHVLVRRFDLGMVRRYLLQSSLMAVFLLPILATHFQDVSMAGFLLGGLWALLVVAVILSSLPLFCFPLGLSRALGWFPFFVLSGMRWISYIVARVPIASFVFPAPKFVETLAYFGLVFLLLHDRKATGQATGNSIGKTTRKKIKLQVAASQFDFQKLSDVKKAMRFPKLWPVSSHTRRLLILPMSLILFASALFRFFLPWPEMVFLSVGQGDCAVIRSKSTVIVVDTGTDLSAKRVLVPYLKRQGVRQIDLCVISHLHADHVGGLGELCSNFKVKTVMTCPGSTEAVARIIVSDVKHSKCVPLHIVEAGAGEAYRIGTVLMTVIHPQKDNGRIYEGSLGSGQGSVDRGIKTSGLEGLRGLDNQDSLVIGLEFNKFPAHAELWGDAPGKVVLDLIEDRNRKNAISIVKVPHHGSPDSLVHGFYERLAGGVAVISVGPNSYGHPSSDVIKAAEKSGLTVYRTDIDGAVTVKVYKNRVMVDTFIR